MRLSTPLWTTFFSRKQRLGISLFRTARIHPYSRHGVLSASIAYASASMATLSHLHPSIDDLTKKLDSLAPRFELQAGEIEVLTTPEEFYSTLKKKISSAQRRVFLSSLYIGKEETELVSCLESVC